jgi:hypothetical protein
VSLVGNNFIAGSNTHAASVGIVRNSLGSKGLAGIFLQDNRFEGDFIHISPSIEETQLSSPPCPLSTKPLPAKTAYAEVLQEAGAFPRDGLDEKVVKQVRNRGGHIVSQPGVIPDILPGSAYPDEDGDGMDDRWEGRNGADPRRADAWDDADGDGLANLDAFLDDRSRSLIAGGASA